MSTKEMEHLFYFSPVTDSDQELSWSHFFILSFGVILSPYMPVLTGDGVKR